ncbi:ribonuclease Y [bacterium]|nr:ribonuclease Y [bacterium]
MPLRIRSPRIPAAKGDVVPWLHVSLLVIGAGVVGGVLGWLGHRVRARRLHGLAIERRDSILSAARHDAEDLLKTAKLEAKDELLRARAAAEQDAQERRQELTRRQAAIDGREQGLNRKVEFLDQKEHRLDTREREIKDREHALDERERELARAVREQHEALEDIAGLTRDQARERLTTTIVDEARHRAAVEVRRIQQETERRARQQAQKILSLAIQRYAGSHAAEDSVSVVNLPGDDMKGRIIGREGRNIRSFEEATGVDVIIDDTPEAVILSAFDPVRREVARLALTALIRDGRIHPGRIEELVERTSAEMGERLQELGEAAAIELGLQNVHAEALPVLGRLHFRTSYGQNLLIHSKEVATIAGIIASELGLDAQLARRCGFLHDVGKAVDHEMDGPHALIGGKLCRKFGEHPTVVNAVEAHHMDVEPATPYTFVTAAADAISAGRPGARRESIEHYVTRLESLESIAAGFDGVVKSYAIQAGREVRILVDHALVSDDEAALLAEEIGRRVESELEYPGQIKIMVIRETRASAVAR